MNESDWGIVFDYPLGPASIVFDVGAFQGKWTNEVSKRFGCKVIAYEPIPEYYEECKRVFAGNRRITVINCGAWNKSGFVTLYPAGEKTSHFLTNDNPVQAGMMDIAILVRAYGHIDLVSINAEGAEYEIIDRLISSKEISRVRFLQAEFHDYRIDMDEAKKRIKEGMSATHEVKFEKDGWIGWSPRELSAKAAR